ncbi:hypothetical protein [Cellulomonas sp. HZM]|uniref:hypothetical protein n=1 Tax=Cellulomonas sp. HZM TaxID=1454010 RepID=UPI00049329B4|nr:hypothetical protein [Cellulomonas sp. HZM]
MQSAAATAPQRTARRGWRRRARHAGRPAAVLLAVVAALVLGGGGAAWAWWTVGSTLPTVAAAAAAVPPPTGTFGCTPRSNGGGLLAYNSSLDLTWGAATTTPTRYLVHVVGSDGTVLDVDAGTALTLNLVNTDLDPSATTTYTVTVVAQKAYTSVTWSSTALTQTVKATRKTFIIFPYYEMSCA